MAGSDTAQRVEAVDLGCPDCGHYDQAQVSWLDRLLERRGSRVVRECPWRVEAMADYCGCEHLYHSR